MDIQQINAHRVRSFHVFIETTHTDHSKVQIAIDRPGTGGLTFFELPEPFGCVLSLILLGCARLQERIQHVPEALRSHLSHEAAQQMLIDESFANIPEQTREMH
jgi:hypothetical protein